MKTLHNILVGVVCVSLIIGHVGILTPHVNAQDAKPSGIPGPTGETSACMVPKDDLFKNPYNKDSAFHRPIGTDAIYASDNDPVQKSWNLQSGMILNVGKSYGIVIIEGIKTDPLATITYDPSTPANYTVGTGLPITIQVPPGLGGYQSDSLAGAYDGETETIYEIYRLYEKGGQYMASGVRKNDARGLGHTPPGERIWAGVTAAGISAFSNALRGFEINTPGFKIQHALNLSIFYANPGMSSKEYIWPAVSTDGFCSQPSMCTGNIPYGALMAIPPVSKGGPNLESLGLSEPGKRVVEALRDYGMYFYDTAGSVNMRTDQYINSTVASQVTADLTNVYKYIKMVKNNEPNQAASGGGTPLAPNCAFDAQ